MKQSFFHEKLAVSQVVKNVSAFMEFQASLTFSRDTTRIVVGVNPCAPDSLEVKAEGAEGGGRGQ
jgi:hypothetical protein